MIKDLGLGPDEVIEDVQELLLDDEVRKELDEELNVYLASGDALPFEARAYEELLWIIGDAWLERIYAIHHVEVSTAASVADDSYFISGYAEGTGQIYSLVPKETFSSLSPSEKDMVARVVDHGAEVALVVYRTAWVEFSAIFTPPRSFWNVGVMDGGPIAQPGCARAGMPRSASA